MLRFGSFVYARRKLVLALSGVLLVLSIVAMGALGGSLSSTGFVDESSESEQVGRELAATFGRGGSTLVVLFDSDVPVDGAARVEVETALAPLTADPRVVQVLTPWNTGNPAMVSSDGSSVYALALLALDDDAAVEELDALTSQVRSESLDVSFTGAGPIGDAISHEVEASLLRAETVAIPLTIVIQVVIFGGLVAAGVPLLVGGLAIVGAMAAVIALSLVTGQSVFAMNIISLLGLGLGIDYSLFMVSRFREEIRTRPTGEAVAVTMATVGKAILFSGFTVIFGLAATQFFPLMALRSMGQAGMLVVALALVYGLTFLPALLGVLGPRVNALGMPARLRRERGPRGGESRFWHALAVLVMRRPLVVLLPVLVLLLASGIPFLRLNLTAGDERVLPEDNPARVTMERIKSEFPGADADALPVIVTATDGDALSPASVAATARLVERALAIPGVTGVESFLTTPDYAPIDWSGYDGTAATLPAASAATIERMVRGDRALLQVVTSEVGDSELQREIIRELRALDDASVDVTVGGSTASSLDTIAAIRDAVPPALAFVLVGTYLILLLSFGSVLLPLKAIAMTLLSIAASLGALVLVFQDGHLASLFGFTPTGAIITTTPILMFCILFGLSMDYEVLMLSRVQEEWARTHDNTTSVALGLERTGKVITGAAAIMVVVFGAFMLASIVIIQSMGFGLALAVLIDATIVRGLLVPSTMRLMGRWNWWAPAPLTRLVDRLGLSHREPRVAAASGD